MKGNLTIEEGGNLTFKNVTLKMNCSEDGEFGIIVTNSAELYIFDFDKNTKTSYDRSNITAFNREYEFKFLVDSGTTFEMKNSELSECGYSGGVNGKAGLTLKTNNTIIENSSFYNNYYGFYLYSSSYNMIINNSILSNTKGIILSSSFNNILLNNTVISNKISGIYLVKSNNNKLNNNSLQFNLYNEIHLYDSKNNTIENNTVYHDDFDGWDCIILDYSNNNQISNNNIYGEPSYWLIHLLNSNNNIVMFNNITNKKSNIGIFLEYSNNNSIIDNIINLCSSSLKLSYSNFNIISNNSFLNNTHCIYFYYSNNNLVIQNNFIDNRIGIHFRDSNNNTIEKINIYNHLYGVQSDRGSSNNPVINSTISSSEDYDYFINKDSEIMLTNTYLDTNRVFFEDETSNLIVQWFLSVQVLDKNHKPIQDAIVRIQNNEDGNFDKNFSTNSEGRVNWVNITEFIKNKKEKTFFLPYKIRAEKNGMWNETTIEIDKNKEIVIILEGIGSDIVYVDDDNTGFGNGTIEYPYNTIQEAVDNAKEGFTIYIFEGTYYENVEIEKRINLIGQNKENTIIDAGGEGSVIYLNVYYQTNKKYISISCLTLKNASNGLNLDHCYFVNISNNQFYDNTVGIILYGGEYVSLYINQIYKNNRAISSKKDYDKDDKYPKNIFIENNEIYNNKVGIEGGSDNQFFFNNKIYKNSEGNFFLGNNSIVGNMIYDNGGFGLYINGENNIIQKNQIYNNNIDGISLMGDKNEVIQNIISNNRVGIIIDSENNILKNNTLINNGIKINYPIIDENFVENNTLNDRKIYYLSDVHGTKESPVIIENDAGSIILFDCSYFEIKYNNLSHGVHGIYAINCDYINIHNNTVSNSLWSGILFGGRNSSIINNKIYNNKINGINIYNAYSAVENNKIYNNEIYNNSEYGVSRGTETRSIDAKYNWWGDDSGPYHPTKNPLGKGDNVSDYVDFIPWLTKFFSLKIDLTLTPSEIWIEGTLKVNETVRIKARIHNIGDLKIITKIKIFDGKPIENDSNLIDFSEISINGKANYIVTADWTPQKSGNHTIFVIIEDSDPDESNIENNEANITLFVEKEEIAKTVDNPSENDDNSYIPNAKTLGISTVIGIGIIVGFFFFGTEIGLFKLYIAFLLPLYFKLTKKDIEERLDEDKFTVGSIFGSIKTFPGITYTGIKKTIGLNNGTVTHHLNRLEKMEFIKSKIIGRHKHFYPVNMKIPEEDIKLNQTQQIIIRKIEEKPGISQIALASSCGISKQLVNYHIRVLSSTEPPFIKLKKIGRNVKCYIFLENDTDDDFEEMDMFERNKL